MIYLDTSTLGPLYWPEALSRRIQGLVAAADSVAISELSQVELFSAISRRVRMEEIARDDASRIAAMFIADISHGVYTRLGIEPSHFIAARDLIARFDMTLRTLDALHLVVASSSRLRLITADRALAKSAGILGVDANLVEN